jgi:hypothetical protein
MVLETEIEGTRRGPQGIIRLGGLLYIFPVDIPDGAEQRVSPLYSMVRVDEVRVSNSVCRDDRGGGACVLVYATKTYLVHVHTNRPKSGRARGWLREPVRFCRA